MSIGSALLLLVASLTSATPVAPVAAGNALTLPTQRHLLRMTPPDSGPVLLLAVQQQGVAGRGLGLFRSVDEGASWQYDSPTQDDYSHTDRADLLARGDDLFVIHSIETPAGMEITGSTRHDVIVQHWAYAGSGRWTMDRSTVVFDSTSSSTAYYRATATFDSAGRLWVSAFRLEADQTSSVLVAVSSDEGETFAPQVLGGGLRKRAGGRIEAAASKLIVLFDEHDAGTPARYFVRSESSALTAWSSMQTAFSEGIYHGAAFSSLGGALLHLAYKDESEVLRYRTWNGSAFSSSTVIDSRMDWAMQPALARTDGELYLF